MCWRRQCMILTIVEIYTQELKFRTNLLHTNFDERNKSIVLCMLCRVNRKFFDYAYFFLFAFLSLFLCPLPTTQNRAETRNRAVNLQSSDKSKRCCTLLANFSPYPNGWTFEMCNENRLKYTDTGPYEPMSMLYIKKLSLTTQCICI